MEMAFALLIGRDGAGALRPSTTFTTPTAFAIRPGSAYGAAETGLDLDPHPAVQLTALTTPITHKGAGYAS
jgi:hypothetical protein